MSESSPVTRRGTDVCKRRTVESLRRRTAPSHRHEGNLARRAPRSVHRTHRAHQSGGQRGDGGVLRACTGRGQSRGAVGHARRRPGPPAWSSGRHQGSGRDRRIADDVWLAALSRLHSGTRQRDGRARTRGRRDRGGKNERSRVWCRREQPQLRLGRNGQSVRSDAQCRRLFRRLRGRARDKHAAGLYRIRHRWIAAHPGG